MFGRRHNRIAQFAVLPIYSPGLDRVITLMYQYISAAAAEADMSGRVPDSSDKRFVSQAQVDRQAYIGLAVGIGLIILAPFFFSRSDQDEAGDRASSAGHDGDAAYADNPNFDACPLQPTEEVYGGGKTVIARYCDWGVTYQRTDSDDELCYVFSYPVSTTLDPESTQRKRPNLFVTTWKSRAMNKTPGVVSGFPMFENTEMTVALSGSTFTLRTDGEDGYFRDRDDELQFKKLAGWSSSLTVQEEVPGSAVTEDTYSLNGFAEAYGAMEQLCAERG